MFNLKKGGSFLAVLTAFSLLAGTFPIHAFAEVYTGELQLPNTQIIPDYRQAISYTSRNGQVNPLLAGGYAYPTVNEFNNSYSASPASFTARENNNFITSLPQ